MKCPKCGSPLIDAEHLPTEEHGTYRYTCGSERDDNLIFYQTTECFGKERGCKATMNGRYRSIDCGP